MVGSPSLLEVGQVACVDPETSEPGCRSALTEAEPRGIVVEWNPPVVVGWDEPALAEAEPRGFVAEGNHPVVVV